MVFKLPGVSISSKSVVKKKNIYTLQNSCCLEIKIPTIQNLLRKFQIQHLDPIHGISITTILGDW